MPLATRTFRVFISSTFEDLKVEREWLHQDVFREMEKLCEDHGARFQAVDLRWGIRSEATLDHRTMEICLAEIERCRRTGVKPNFIVLLGDRYGWRPVPARIDAGEFEQILSATFGDGQELLVGNDAWYRRDDNANPPEYVLRPRHVAAPADRSTAAWDLARSAEESAWAATESGLRAVLLAALDRLGWSPDDERRTKYEASATHQEILAGLGTRPEEARHVFAFVREPAPGTEHAPDLKKLEEYLRSRIGADRVDHFAPGDETAFRSLVESRLRTVIAAEIEAFESVSPLEVEIQAHDEFAWAQARTFSGMAAAIERLRQGGRYALAVRAPAGSGKTALLARASCDVRGAAPVRRFVGLTPAASRGASLLHSVCEQISREYGKQDETPGDFSSLVRVFYERLALGSRERPVAVFLDGLDELAEGDPARTLSWLGEPLPQYAVVVFSSSTIPPSFSRDCILDLDPLAPEEAESLLDQWLATARRRLTDSQRGRVLAASGKTGLPLHLKLAFDEARLWPSYAAETECLLSDGLTGMIDVVFNRLSANANHGPVFPGRSLAYLTAARHGLTEQEALGLLSEDQEVRRDLLVHARQDPGRKLPVIIWSRLCLDLEPYLSEMSLPSGTVLRLQHPAVARRATERYLPEGDRPHLHSLLAGYFETRADPRGDGSFRGACPRGLSEVVYHRTLAGGNGPSVIVRDFAFLRARCGLDLGSPGVYGLLEDLRFAESRGDVPAGLITTLYAAAPLLATFPESLYQEVSNSGAMDGITHLPDQETLGPWFRLRDAPTRRPFRLEAHGAGHVVCRFSSDGCRLWTAAADFRIRQWDARTLCELEPPIALSGPVWRLDGHPFEPWLAALAGMEDTLRVRVFDVTTGRPVFSYPDATAPKEPVMRTRSYGAPQVYSGECVPTARPPQGSFDGAEFFGALAFTPSGDTLFAALGGNEVLRISTADWTVKGRASASGQVSCLAAARDGEPWAGVLSRGTAGGAEGTLALASACAVLADGSPVWGTTTGSVRHDPAGNGGVGQAIASFGSTVVGCVATEDREVWAALEDGAVVRVNVPDGPATSIKLEQRITSLDYSPSCKLAAVGLADGTVELIPRLAAGAREGKEISRIALSPNGETVAAVRRDRIFLSKGEPGVLETRGEITTTCRFLDLERLVTGTSSGWVRILRLPSGQVEAAHRIGGMIASINCAPSVGAITILTNLGDLFLWMPDDGPPRRLLPNVRRASFSASGRWLAFAPRSDGVGVLDRQAGWAISGFLWPQQIDFLAVSPDDQWLYGGNGIGSLARWRLPLAEDALEVLSACRKGTADLMTLDEVIVLLGETCEIRVEGKPAGALRLPGLRCWDTAPGAGMVALCSAGGSPGRYSVEFKKGIA